jgi:peroxiredoxin
MGGQASIPLLIIPGEQAVVHAGLESFPRNYSVEGSEESLAILELNRHMASTKRRLDSLSRAWEENSGDGEKLRSIEAEYSAVYEELRRYNIRFVLDNRNSMAAIYALYQKFDEENFLLNTYRDVQLHKITAESLDTLYPDSEYVQSLKRDAANLEQEIRNRNIQNVMDVLPTSFPEIRLPDPYGDTIALSSLSGKVILLSFWASWNQESLNLNQEFKVLYDRYQGRGLEIYQVSFDSELEPWMRTISFDELPWINVSELTYPESVVAMHYNVADLPTFFLIDRQGDIVGKNFEIRELDRKIAELLLNN